MQTSQLRAFGCGVPRCRERKIPKSACGFRLRHVFTKQVQMPHCQPGCSQCMLCSVNQATHQAVPTHSGQMQYRSWPACMFCVASCCTAYIYDGHLALPTAPYRMLVFVLVSCNCRIFCRASVAHTGAICFIFPSFLNWLRCESLLHTEHWNLMLLRAVPPFLNLLSTSSAQS